mgnify:CR=1 FL=1
MSTLDKSLVALVPLDEKRLKNASFLVSSGSTDSSVAEYLGLSRDEYLDRLSGSDPALKAAHQAGLDAMEASLLQTVLGLASDTDGSATSRLKASTWLLERKFRYAEPVEHGPQVQVLISLPQKAENFTEYKKMFVVSEDTDNE